MEQVHQFDESSPPMPPPCSLSSPFTALMAFHDGFALGDVAFLSRKLFEWHPCQALQLLLLTSIRCPVSHIHIATRPSLPSARRHRDLPEAVARPVQQRRLYYAGGEMRAKARWSYNKKVRVLLSFSSALDCRSSTNVVCRICFWRLPTMKPASSRVCPSVAGSPLRPTAAI